MNIIQRWKNMDTKNNIAIINTCDWGSTGKIAIGLLNYLKKQGKNAVFYYGRGGKGNSKDIINYCYKVEVWMHYLHARLTGLINSASFWATKRLIKQMRNRNIDSLFIINLHGYYLNEKIFWNYLVQDNINVVYIMADEYAFLGNCTYREGCERFKDNCRDCPNKTVLQKMFFKGRSEYAFLLKKQTYGMIKKIAFVAPEFVINSAKESPLLINQKLCVVDEAIDVKINRPRNTADLRKQLGIDEDKIIIACVAPYSYSRKGVRFFIEAARRLEKDNRFIFVQVGFDNKDTSILPSNYIPIGYISNQDLLTHYYSLADMFVFPSLQDTMPNACLEALACGTPLLCFNTSGMPYMADETVMTLVEPRDVDQMVSVIINTPKKSQEIISRCRQYAMKRYDNQKYFKKLVDIMNDL